MGSRRAIRLELHEDRLACPYCETPIEYIPHAGAFARRPHLPEMRQGICKRGWSCTAPHQKARPQCPVTKGRGLGLGVGRTLTLFNVPYAATFLEEQFLLRRGGLFRERSVAWESLSAFLLSARLASVRFRPIGGLPQRGVSWLVRAAPKCPPARGAARCFVCCMAAFARIT
jgi:hypothetical protein